MKWRVLDTDPPVGNEKGFQACVPRDSSSRFGSGSPCRFRRSPETCGRSTPSKARASAGLGRATDDRRPRDDPSRHPRPAHARPRAPRRARPRRRAGVTSKECRRSQRPSRWTWSLGASSAPRAAPRREAAVDADPAGPNSSGGTLPRLPRGRRRRDPRRRVGTFRLRRTVPLTVTEALRDVSREALSRSLSSP